METISDMLRRHEGFRSKPYLDTVGVPTFGYGFTYITKAEADEILNGRVAELYRSCSARWEWFEDLCDIRKLIIMDMAYNLGIEGLANLKHIIAPIEGGRWADASAEMLSSRWATQVGSRARELAGMMMLPGE